MVYILEKDRAAVLAGSWPLELLVLHVNVGDCLEVRLRNETDAPVSLHGDLLAYDPAKSGVVPPDEVSGYTLFAHPAVGETAALLRDVANVLRNPRLGLYGAVIVGARGSRYSHPATGEDLGAGASWAVDVHPVSGPSYADLSLFLQDEDEAIGTAQMLYNEQVQGLVGLNYGGDLWSGGWSAIRTPPSSSAVPSTAIPRRRLLRPLQAIGYGSTSASRSASRRTSSAWRDTAGR